MLMKEMMRKFLNSVRSLKKKFQKFIHINYIFSMKQPLEQI